MFCGREPFYIFIKKVTKKITRKEERSMVTKMKETEGKETEKTVTEERSKAEGNAQKGGKGTLIAALAATLAATAVVILLVILAVIFQPKPQSGDKSITVTITDDNGVDAVYEHNTDAEYLLEAVREIEGLELQGEEGEYGFYINAVNGITADYSIDQSYWAIYVNGEYGSYGIESQPIADGDAFSIVYERSAY